MSEPRRPDNIPLDNLPRQRTDLENGPDDATQVQPDQAPHEDLHPSDGTEDLFSMYLDRVIEEDKRMVETWKGEAEGMLTFVDLQNTSHTSAYNLEILQTGLFSAAVAALLVVTIQDIRPNSQDTSAFYLAHIYQQSSTQPNGSRPSIPSTLSDPTEPFSPPTSSVWVNGLWISSLVISLSCALLATLLLQWARRYVRVAYPRYHPQKQARIRAFYEDGVKKWRIPRAVEVLPMLLHISLFLFFAGLSVFLFGVNRTIFKAVTALISLIVIFYACLTLFPVIYKNSVYSTPLSALFSFCINGIRYLFFRLRSSAYIFNFICMLLPNRQPGNVHLDGFFSPSMVRTVEEYACKLKPNIDHESLLWTFKSLRKDADFEKFFEGLPRLCDSVTGKELKLKEEFIDKNKLKLSDALTGLVDRTLKSNLVKYSVKYRRMLIFTKVIESKSTSLLDPLLVLRRVLFENWHGFLESVDLGLFLQNWTETSSADRVTSFYAQCAATLTISTVEDRDKRWLRLATDNCHPLSRSLRLNHRHYEDHHSILLINAILIVRTTVQAYSGSKDSDRNDILSVSRRTLEAVCTLELDIRHALPELQHEFCDLWNKLIRTAQDDQPPHHRSISVKMLKTIRKLYIAFHSTPETFNTAYGWEQVLDNSSFYPKCTEDDHRPSSPFPNPNLQFDSPPTPAQSDALTPSSIQFPEPHTPSHAIPLSSPSPAGPPSPGFPITNPSVPYPQLTSL